MTYEDAVRMTEDLRTRYDGAFTSLDKANIALLYAEVLGKQLRVTRCQRCFHDALIEVQLYLRREQRMREKCAYALRAGFIIHCPTFRGGKIYTNENITDDVCAEYLQRFPTQRAMFSRVPENYAVSAEKGSPLTTTPAPAKKANRRKKTKK